MVLLYLKSKFLLVSEIKKMATSSPSIYRDFHGLMHIWLIWEMEKIESGFILEMKKKVFSHLFGLISYRMENVP